MKPILIALLFALPIVFAAAIIRGTSSRKRYTVFAVLLGCGVSAQIIGAITALVVRRPAVAFLFLVTAALLGLACILEMRKLSREF